MNKILETIIEYHNLSVFGSNRTLKWVRVAVSTKIYFCISNKSKEIFHID
jgi:hypothetical protein